MARRSGFNIQVENAEEWSKAFRFIRKRLDPATSKELRAASKKIGEQQLIPTLQAKASGIGPQAAKFAQKTTAKGDREALVVRIPGRVTTHSGLQGQGRKYSKTVLHVSEGAGSGRNSAPGARKWIRPALTQVQPEAWETFRKMMVEILRKSGAI